MALLSKVDYYGLSASGFAPASTSEGKSVGYTAEAQGPNGFLVAIDVGPDHVAPTVDYVATSNVTLTSVVLGQPTTILGKQICLGGLTINTAAGQPVTATATGSQIEDGGTGHCKCTLGSLSLESLFHAQTFGLFTVNNGQLTQSTLNIESNMGTAVLDGIIKASDLIGGQIRCSGTIVGVNNSGAISTPTISINAPSGNVLSGVMTTPLTQTNPNGDFPSYNFEITWALKADTNS